MLSKSTREAVHRRMDVLKEKFTHVTLDVTLVETVPGLRSFLQLPSGISPDEWDCDPDPQSVARSVSEGGAAVIAVWDNGQEEKVFARLLDEANAFSLLNQIEQFLPVAPRKKRAPQHH